MSELHNNGKKLFRSQQAGIAALFVTVATLLSTVLGLVRDKVMAHYFGASLDTDLYNYGTRIPDALQTILIMGVTSSSFIPMFSEFLAQRGYDAANRLASSFLNITLSVFIGICLLIGIGMPVICDVWLSPDLPPDQKNTIVHIARIFLASQIAFALSKILSGILQTHKHFTAYGLALLVYNPAIIFGMVIFHDTMGIDAAAYGALIGSVFVVLVTLLDLRGTGYRYNFQWFWDKEGVQRIFVLAIPNFLNMALLQFVILAYSKISIHMPDGSFSAFNYALNFESFPVSVFGISFVTAIFPYLSENASQRNFQNFNYNIQNSLRQILFLTLPSGIGMAVLSYPIISLILGGGRFGAEAIEMTSSTLFFYALVVPLESLWYLFARAFYAIKDTWSPFWYRFIGTIINLGISYSLAQSMGPSAFSLGLLAAFLIQIVLFTFGLKRRVPEVDIQSATLTAGKLLACALAQGAVVWILVQWLPTLSFINQRAQRMQDLMVVGTSIVAGMIVYFTLTAVFKCADFSVLQRVLNRIMKKEGA